MFCPKLLLVQVIENFLKIYSLIVIKMWLMGVFFDRSGVRDRFVKPYLGSSESKIENIIKSGIIVEILLFLK